MIASIRSLIATLLLAAMSIVAPADSVAEEFSDEVRKRYSIEVSPYSVLVEIEAPAELVSNEQRLSELIDDYKTRVKRNAGNAWQLEVRSSAENVFQVASTKTTRSSDWSKYDKVFRFAISTEPAGIAISGVEFDTKTESQTEKLSRKIVTQRFLAHELTAMTAILFRPLAAVEISKLGDITLRKKASRISTPNPEWFQLKDGDLFTVSRLYSDREGVVKKRYQIPWTYLRVSTTDGTSTECEVVSAFRSPLAGVQRRVETIAIAATPLLTESELILKKRKPRGKEEVFGSAQVKLAHNYVPGKPVEFHTQLTTTRLGQTRIQRDQTPIHYLFVYSGETVLARVPCVPGLSKSISLVVPDDSAQLKVDGELRQIKSDLIDLVARRTVLFARAKLLAKQGRFELPKDENAPNSDSVAANQTVAGILKQIENLPTERSFDERILAVRVTAVDASLKAGDRVGANRIKKQCADVEQLVERYLSDDRLKLVKEQLDELKKVAEEDANT